MTIGVKLTVFAPVSGEAYCFETTCECESVEKLKAEIENYYDCTNNCIIIGDIVLSKALFVYSIVEIIDNSDE